VTLPLACYKEGTQQEVGGVRQGGFSIGGKVNKIITCLKKEEVSQNYDRGVLVVKG